MLRTSISLDDNTVRKLDRLQDIGGYSNRSAAITGIINDYESAMLQLEVLQEYFRVTKGMVNPNNEIMKQKNDIVIEPKTSKKEDVVVTTVKNIDKFKKSYNDMPD